MLVTHGNSQKGRLIGLIEAMVERCWWDQLPSCLRSILKAVGEMITNLTTYI